MIKTFSDETLESIHRKGMDQLRLELSGFSQQFICQQMGWKKHRYRLFFSGKIDNQVRAIEISKLRLIIYFNRSTIAMVKDPYLFRMLGRKE